MLWKNSKNTWKSSLMVMELCFDYSFDLTFDDTQSGNYMIRFYKKSLDVAPKSLGDQVISLNWCCIRLYTKVIKRCWKFRGRAAFLISPGAVLKRPAITTTHVVKSSSINPIQPVRFLNRQETGQDDRFKLFPGYPSLWIEKLPDYNFSNFLTGQSGPNSLKVRCTSSVHS